MSVVVVEEGFEVGEASTGRDQNTAKTAAHMSLLRRCHCINNALGYLHSVLQPSSPL